MTAMSVKPVAWMHVAGGSTVTDATREGMDKVGKRQYSIPLYSAPAPELAEALQRISNAYWDGELSGDMVRDADKLLARIIPK